MCTWNLRVTQRRPSDIQSQMLVPTSNMFLELGNLKPCILDLPLTPPPFTVGKGSHRNTLKPVPVPAVLDFVRSYRQFCTVWGLRLRVWGSGLWLRLGGQIPQQGLPSLLNGHCFTVMRRGPYNGSSVSWKSRQCSSV